MFFKSFLSLLILQRLIELHTAKQNQQWALNQGGYEVGRSHYKWMVLLHSLFILSLTIEYFYQDPQLPSWWWISFSFLIAAQGLRYWAISSLGRHWNTRIIIIPDTTIQPSGPYRYIRHPNYVAVFIEILCFPLIFGLFITAFLFTSLNITMIFYRISVEEQALLDQTTYHEAMQKTPRFIPRRK